MLTVVARCVVKKEEIQNFKDYTVELIAESRKEIGNISYALYQDNSNPQILTFIEEWQDEAALEEHRLTKHFVAILPKLRLLQEVETEVNLYTKC